MNIGGNLVLEQQQRMSQSQLQSLSILAFDTLELKKFMKNEYLENPMLDCRNPEGTDASVTSVTYGKSYGELVEGGQEAYYEAADHRGEDIRQFLLDQLPGDMSGRDRAITDYMIGCLEDNGYFRISVSELAQELSEPQEKLEELLTLLRGLEPWGIFSENLSQCIRRQLEKAGDTDPLLFEIADHYMDAFLHGRISEITRATGKSTAEVRKCLERIAEMNPNPLYGFSDKAGSYIEPDILLKKTESGWKASLNDQWVENYGLNDYYLRMMKSTEDPELREYFRSRLERARLIMNSIVQRRKTILGIMDALGEVQKDFFNGDGPLKPLTMGELAASLGIHTSTVSRALRGKYVQYPGGVLTAKSLFAAGVAGDRGEEGITTEEIKKKLQGWIQAEDRRKPYSDSRLTELLKQEGISVSRRVVAKYREQLNIPGSFERKDSV